MRTRNLRTFQPTVFIAPGNLTVHAWHVLCSITSVSNYEGGQDCASARSCMHAAEAQALVRESDELIAIVTTIIKNKRKNVSAKKAAEKAAKAAARRTASSPS
jgi:hypothetical protein